MTKNGMNFLQSLILGILITIVYEFNPRIDVNPTFEYAPGFCLSFDDDSFDAWQHLRPLLDKYDVKVTFFVTLRSDLTGETQHVLERLSQDGHEIGAHGKSHIDPIQLIRHMPIADYVKDEFLFVKNEIEDSVTPILSAAYVAGIRNKTIDKEMWKYFTFIRSVSESQRHHPVTDLNMLEDIFFHKSDQILQPLCIDEIQNICSDDIVTLLKRAKKERKIIMFYAHKPVETPKKEHWEISLKVLETIFMTCKSLGLHSYLVKDLQDA